MVAFLYSRRKTSWKPNLDFPFFGANIMSSSANEPVPGEDVDLLWERTCSGLAPGSCSHAVRNLKDGDLERLVPLVYSAFAGSVDSAPLETWGRKLLAIVSNQYGPFLSTASFAAETPSGQLAGTILATDFALYKAPVIALIAVAPGTQHQGLGSYLLRRSIQALALEGFPNCRARISPGNDASLQLFRKTGFQLGRVDLDGSPHSGGRQAVPPA